jgi:hypothetical protein
VQVEERESEVVLTFCRVVPEREAWLWENKRALDAVSRGLRQATSGELGDGPDLDAGAAVADTIPDEET